MPWFIRIVGCALFCALPIAGQQPPQEPPAHLRVNVRLVTVDVSVVDAEGRFVSGLQQRNFRVFDDGEEQSLTVFSPESAPVRVVLLVEANPAVFLIRRDHLTAALHLLSNLRPDDEVALLSYADAMVVEEGFTTDKQAVKQRLLLLGRYSRGMAEIHTLDAVAAALDWAGDATRRTALLVIGTGLDSGSRAGWEKLQHRLAESQATVFAVAAGSLLRAPAEGEKKEKKEEQTEAGAAAERYFAEADRRLREIAEAGAGEAYFPQSERELPPIYRRIAERIRNLYSLGYRPPANAPDGRFHPIEVRLVDEKGVPLVVRNREGEAVDYRIFARKGYIARKR